MAKDKATPETIERRVLTVDEGELRIDGGEAPKLGGYAAKFGKWSTDFGGFREKIRAGAFDEALKESDVRALKNHDANLILGRTPKTLRLTTNSVGLKFEVDVPDTTTGRDTVEEVRRGDISGCSFSFTVLEDDWKYKEDSPVERTIIKIDRLFDVGPVTYPAYPDTTVAARALEQVRESDGWPSVTAAAASEPPGGPPPDNDTEADAISAERQREIDKEYRHAGRIIQRCQAAESR